jgi:peroxiredoxin
LARFRDDYAEYQKRQAEVLAVGPDGPRAFDIYWRSQSLPFTGLPDPEHHVARLYRQQVKLLKLGRMPMVSVIDRAGWIRYVHYGSSMSDIPSNRDLLSILDQLEAGDSR